MSERFVTIHIDASDLAEIGTRAAAAAQRAPERQRDVVARVSQILWQAVQREAPVRTGALQRSITRTFVGGGSGALIWEGVPYGRFVREGIRGHVIRPRFKKALYWPGAAHPVPQVRHPGTRPNPYHERAVDQQRPEMEEIAGEAARRIAIDIARPLS